MEVKTFFLVCLIGLATPLFSQEKEQPPSPMTIIMSKDSSQAVYRRPRIELPDVVIYGKDMLILKRQRPLYEGKIEFEVRESEKRLAGRRIGMKTSKLSMVEERRPRLIGIRAQYGSEKSQWIEVVNASHIGVVDYAARVSYLNRGDWVENGRSRDLETDVRADWGVRGASLVSSVYYGRREFGYYGESSEERTTFSQYSLRQQVFLPAWEFMVTGGGRRLSGVDEEGMIGLGAKTEQRFGALPLGSNMYYMHASGTGVLDLINLSVYSFFSPYEWLDESIGLCYTSANRVKRLAPFARIDIDVGVNLFMDYRSFIEPHTMAEHVRANQYVRNPRPVAEEHLNCTTLGVYYATDRAIRAQLSLNYEKLKSSPFWRFENGWYLHTMDTERISTKVDVTGHISEVLSADLSLWYGNHSPSLPYVPRLTVEGRANYVAKFGLQLEGVGTYVGERSNSDSRLPAYTTFGIKASKDVLKQVTIFGGIDNLLNTKYETFPEYREVGREIYLGARLRL